MSTSIRSLVIPVTDIDRAKDFYVRLGFNADHDHTVSEDLRFVQLTPPGSACSICIGKGITDAEPGSVVGMQVVVKDIEEAERDRDPWKPGIWAGDVYKVTQTLRDLRPDLVVIEVNTTPTGTILVLLPDRKNTQDLPQVPEVQTMQSLLSDRMLQPY